MIYKISIFIIEILFLFFVAMKSILSVLKSRIHLALQQFPKPIRIFLYRILLFSVIWKMAYLFFLFESKTLDEPLTNYVGKHSAWILNQLYQTDQFQSKLLRTESIFEGQILTGKAGHIYFGKRLVMFIADPCNGLELLVMYLIFILAMPASSLRKLLFIAVGLFIIHFVNLLRCIGLVAILLHYDQYFNIAHHYIFKMMVYISIFLLWVWFSMGINLKISKK